MSKHIINKEILGNPALAYGAAQAAPIVVKEGFSMIKTGLAVALIGGAILITLKAYKKAVRQKWINKASSDNNVNAAIKIYQAIPDVAKGTSGSILNIFGYITDLINKIKSVWQRADTERLMKIADYDITYLNITCQAFKNIYEIDLLYMLASILDKNEYDLFISKSNGEKSKTEILNDPTQIGKAVITNCETIGFILDNNFWNMTLVDRMKRGIKQMQNRIAANTYVGNILNGKNINIKDTRTGKNIKYWVMVLKSKGKTFYLSFPDTDIRLVSSTQATQYMKPIPLGRIESQEEGIQVKAIKNASVYLDNKAVGIAYKGNIIGDYHTEKKDKSGNEYIQFRTKQDKIILSIRKEFVELKKQK